ncbi:unnamed protein product [Caenorhabditis brenneri]
MSEVFETNEIAYRACILYEAVRKTPLEDAYKNMKEVKPNVEYWDFEYWYYRFSNSQHDLNHDRSKDPKSVGFSDMPIDVVDNIVGYLGLEDKLSTRKVCRNMRAVIDKQSSKFGEVGLAIDEKSCEVYYEGLGIHYYAKENGTYLLETPRRTISLKAITHPKWSFEDVNISISRKDSQPETVRNLLLFFNSLLSNHKIHVDSLSIHARSLEPLAILLPHFKTDDLDFVCWPPMNDTNLLEVIVKMDEWENLKRFSLCSFPDEFPIEALFHLEECYVTLINLTEDRLMKIRDILFKSPNFTYFDFSDDKKYDSLEVFTALIDRIMGEHDAYDPLTKVYRIENSKDYIQLSFDVFDFYKFRIERIRS